MTEKIIYEELTKLGGSVSLKGFDYSLSAIQLLYQNDDLKITEMYNDIAKKKNTTGSRVERAIRHFVHSIFKLSNDKMKYQHINFVLNKDGFPTNTEFLKSMVYYLKYNEMK